MIEKNYGSLNFRNLVINMDVVANNHFSDSHDSTSNSVQVRKKSEHPDTVKQFL
jgi:hypothetical protein